MAIEPSHENVERDGRVVHPYLAAWDKVCQHLFHTH